MNNYYIEIFSTIVKFILQLSQIVLIVAVIWEFWELTVILDEARQLNWRIWEH